MDPNTPDDAGSTFVQRYTANPQSVSNEEALRQHQHVAAQLPPDDYRQAAEAALARLSPEERVALGRHLLTQAPAAGGTGFPDVNGDGIDDRLQDPRYLAGVTAQVQQQPGLLERLLGGLGLAPGGAPGQAGPPPQAGYPPQAGVPNAGPAYGGSALGGTLGKVALGGIAAAGLSRLLGGGRGGHGGGGGFFGGGYGGGGHHGGGDH